MQNENNTTEGSEDQAKGNEKKGTIGRLCVTWLDLVLLVIFAGGITWALYQLFGDIIWTSSKVAAAATTSVVLFALVSIKEVWKSGADKNWKFHPFIRAEFLILASLLLVLATLAKASQQATDKKEIIVEGSVDAANAIRQDSENTAEVIRRNSLYAARVIEEHIKNKAAILRQNSENAAAILRQNSLYAGEVLKRDSLLATVILEQSSLNTKRDSLLAERILKQDALNTKRDSLLAERIRKRDAVNTKRNSLNTARILKKLKNK